MLNVSTAFEFDKRAESIAGNLADETSLCAGQRASTGLIEAGHEFLLILYGLRKDNAASHSGAAAVAWKTAAPCQSNECRASLYFERPEQDCPFRVRVARAIAARDPQLSFAVWNRQSF